jgi:hypothetical protein
MKVGEVDHGLYGDGQHRYLDTPTSKASCWDFGSNVQLPGLIRGGDVLRDGDANGQLD